MSKPNWGLDYFSPSRYNIGMKTKYTACISARAKDAMDRWRLETGIGRYPLAAKVHKNYYDNRTVAAKRSDKFSARIRPVTVQTHLDDSNLVELLELANQLDIIARYDTTDAGMISNLLGSFLDAVIMGDLIDTIAHPDLVAEFRADPPSPTFHGSTAEYIRAEERKAGKVRADGVS